MAWPLTFFSPFCFSSGNNFFGRTVNGVVNIEILQRIIVLRRDLDVDFLNGADFGIFAGFGDSNRGRPYFARFDEIVVGQAHHFAVIHHADVISAVLFDGDAGRGFVVHCGIERDWL